MPAGRSEAGYRKEVLDDKKITGRPRMDASTTRVSYRVSVTIWTIEQRGCEIDVWMKSGREDSRSQAKDKRLSTLIIKLKNTA